MPNDVQHESDKCQKCGMPLENEQDACPCEPGICYHCCSCSVDCVCGCKSRVRKSEENAEF
ncbi:MAG: hypothetical protein MUD10_04030 [Candidatus Pacebacteria bacterium]|nr:hypothetical protein [Candidatus Paceibacterota bacterium]